MHVRIYRITPGAWWSPCRHERGLENYSEEIFRNSKFGTHISFATKVAHSSTQQQTNCLMCRARENVSLTQTRFMSRVTRSRFVSDSCDSWSQNLRPNLRPLFVSFVTFLAGIIIHTGSTIFRDHQHPLRHQKGTPCESGDDVCY